MDNESYLRTSSKAVLRDAIYHIIRVALARALGANMLSTFISMWGTRRACGHCDFGCYGRPRLGRHFCCGPYPSLVELAATKNLGAATNAERRKETHHRDCALGTRFVPFALEVEGASSDRSDKFLVECATLASRECARPRPLTSLLCTWFRQIVSIASQRSLARTIHARTLRLEQSMVVTSPSAARSTFFRGVQFCC